MKEKDITICGHGSNTPSLKNMHTYLQNRHNAKVTVGGKEIRKDLVAVKRLIALTDQGRHDFHDTYKTILGRNHYDQKLRDYCYRKYKDGRYHSDCSSSGCLTFKKIGYECPTYNCAGIYTSPLFETVPVEIKNGHVTNPEILKVGDALLFAGGTPGRPLNISHVEYIFEMPDGGLEDGVKNDVASIGPGIASALSAKAAKAEAVEAQAVKDGWVKEGKNWYYYKDGEKLKKEWVHYKKHWYRVGNDGKMLTGWHKVPDKTGEPAWCYFDETAENLGAEWHERSDGAGFLEIWTTED